MGSARCAAALLITMAAGASAESADRRTNVHAAAGWSSPTLLIAPPDQRYYGLGAIFDDGGSASIGVGYRLTARLTLNGDLEFSRFAFDPQNRLRYSHPSNNGYLTADRGARIVSLDVSARLRILHSRDDGYRLNLVAGGGASSLSFDVVRNESRLNGRGGTIFEVTPVAYRDTAPSIVAGIATDARLGGRMSIELEWRYRRAFMERRMIINLNEIKGAEYGTLRIGASFALGATAYKGSN
jgi:hypothetical protein